MKTLAVAAVAIALIGAAPRDASAQETGSMAGALAATIVGAAVGGAIGYYYFTGTAATLIGTVGGGAIGDWWYTVATTRNGALPSGKKMNYTNSPLPLLQLIDHTGGTQPRLHTGSILGGCGLSLRATVPGSNRAPGSSSPID